MRIFYIGLALFFIAGSIVEYCFTRKHNGYYSLREFKSSVKLMLAGLFVDLGCKILVIWFFQKLTPYALFRLDYQWWVWILCYIAWDLVFYCKHYCEHNVRFMWAIHVNHHSSTDMNISTSLRSGVFKSSYRYFFWAVIVLIGFPVPMFLVLYGLGKIWAFFSHSQKLGHWGVFEKITITPAHHLLHHSCNEDNLNKNFGETFLIWDKLFGTFKESRGELTFGINEPVNHNNFKDVVFHEFKSMRNDLKHTTSWKEKLKIIFGKPGYRPQYTH
jgi:alkylglycerol monooxygenase